MMDSCLTTANNLEEMAAPAIKMMMTSLRKEAKFFVVSGENSGNL